MIVEGLLYAELLCLIRTQKFRDHHAGLSPGELAVLWRTGDDRKAIQVFTGIFCDCARASG